MEAYKALNQISYSPTERYSTIIPLTVLLIDQFVPADHKQHVVVATRSSSPARSCSPRTSPWASPSAGGWQGAPVRPSPSSSTIPGPSLRLGFVKQARLTVYKQYSNNTLIKQYIKDVCTSKIVCIVLLLLQQQKNALLQNIAETITAK